MFLAIVPAVGRSEAMVVAVAPPTTRPPTDQGKTLVASRTEAGGCHHGGMLTAADGKFSLFDGAVELVCPFCLGSRRKTWVARGDDGRTYVTGFNGTGDTVPVCRRSFLVANVSRGGEVRIVDVRTGTVTVADQHSSGAITPVSSYLQ
jgi:hypothetical protein